MKMSLKTEYACRVLAQLAKRYSQERPTHVEALAEAEQVPANYLVQILNELRNSGLIGSRRGKQGGYFLIREPAEISLYDILTSLDGDILEVKVQHKGESGPRVAEVWEELTSSLREATRKISLSDMVPGQDQHMYHI